MTNTFPDHQTMFIGHFAVALAARRAAPRTSLGVLFAACQFPDLIWPALLLSGAEQVRITPGATAFTPLEFTHYPISHSLLATAMWGVLAAGLYWLVRRDRAGALAVGLLVVSHWLLDWVTHAPDLPLYPGGPRAGLGLWHSVPATLLVEGAVFAAGLGVYLATARPRSAARWVSLGALLALLLFIYLGGLWSPPPVDVRSLAWFAIAAWIIPLWAAAVDRRPSSRSEATGPAAPARTASV